MPIIIQQWFLVCLKPILIWRYSHQVLQYQETVVLITALCYEEEKNYLEAMIQRGNRGIVGHVIETSTVEASTVISGNT